MVQEQIAGSAVGSSDPTYHTNSKRAVITAGGRLLVLYGKHSDGIQLAWRNPGGPWSTVSRGDVLDGRILSGQTTGDIVAAIAVAKDSGGNEVAVVVTAHPSATSTRALQARRLSDLDNPAGPNVGALVTLEAGGAGLGSSKCDIGRERTAGGVERLLVVYQKQTAATPTWDVKFGWFTDLTTDALAFSTTGNFATAITSGSKQLSVIERPGEAYNGVGIISRNALAGTSTTARLAQRAASDPLTTFTEGAGAGVTNASATYCCGVRLGTEWITVQMTNTSTGICTVERFNDNASTRTTDITTAAGYWDPLLTTDGTKAYLFMRKGAVATGSGGGVDDVIVKREYTPGVGWGAETTLLAAGVGGYTEPNGPRDTRGTNITWAIIVPAAGDSAQQSSVQALIEETIPAAPGGSVVAVSADPVAATRHGLPYAASGGLCVDSVAAIAGHVQGWPVTVLGKIAVSSGPAVGHLNGRPVDADGRVVIAEASGEYDGGLPRTAAGALATATV